MKLEIFFLSFRSRDWKSRSMPMELVFSEVLHIFLFIVQLCSHVWLCDPKDHSTPGLPVPYHLLKFVQGRVFVSLMPSSYLSSDTLFSFCPQSFQASGTFPMSWLFASGDQTIGASASTSVLPVSIQGWLPWRLIGLISLLFKRL